MLRSLVIRDFVIVDTLELDFESGFTALTGETGAGKSILIDALSLALGGRADVNVVRVGKARAEIAAEFDLSQIKNARHWLRDNELADDDKNMLLFRRVLDAGGRSKAFINGTSVTLTQMRDLAERLMDVHGQHEHQSLLKRDAQLSLLDGYADNEPLLVEVKAAHGAWSQLAATRVAREANEIAITREFEELSYQIGELGALKFSIARWEEILNEQRRLANAAGLIDSAQSAIDCLDDNEGAILSQVDNVAVRLSRDAETDPALKD